MNHWVPGIIHLSLLSVSSLLFSHPLAVNSWVRPPFPSVSRFSFFSRLFSAVDGKCSELEPELIIDNTKQQQQQQRVNRGGVADVGYSET